jgi:hypothetical protein
MKPFLFFLVYLTTATLSFAQEQRSTEKVTPTQTKKIINESIQLYRKHQPLGSDQYHTITFDNKFVLHLFYTPDLTGQIESFIVNTMGELVLKKSVALGQDKPSFLFLKQPNRMLICYQWKTGREVGPGLSSRFYQRRVEMFDAQQNTVLSIAGDIEHHSFGEEKAAYSFYFDQTNSCSLRNNEIQLSYKYLYWDNTGSYATDSFLKAVDPNENKSFDVYFQIQGDSLSFDGGKSGKLSQSHMQMEMWKRFDSPLYKIEIIKY